MKRFLSSGKRKIYDLVFDSFFRCSLIKLKRASSGLIGIEEEGTISTINSLYVPFSSLQLVRLNASLG